MLVDALACGALGIIGVGRTPEDAARMLHRSLEFIAAKVGVGGFAPRAPELDDDAGNYSVRARTSCWVGAGVTRALSPGAAGDYGGPEVARAAPRRRREKIDRRRGQAWEISNRFSDRRQRARARAGVNDTRILVAFEALTDTHTHAHNTITHTRHSPYCLLHVPTACPPHRAHRSLHTALNTTSACVWFTKWPHPSSSQYVTKPARSGA